MTYKSETPNIKSKKLITKVIPMFQAQQYQII